MALTEVLRSDTFEQWRTKTNTVSSDLGDRATLSANITANTSLVGAINELQSDIGVIGSLSTFAASNIVAALNELKTGSSVTISGTKTFSSNLNLSSGQAYTIDGTSVLNATTLGSGVVTSSLTTVGTIGTGVWQGTIVSPTYGGTGINNGSRTLTISTGNLALTTAAGGSSLTLPASGTVATLAGSETLTTKTINLANNTLTGTLAQFNTALTDDDFAALNTAQTLTNKTIALGSNTISGTLAQFNTALTDDDFAALAATQTLTNKSLQDSTTFFIDDVTPTKRLQFQLSGITANTTRTLTIPDNSGTIALTSDTTFIGTTSITLSRGSGNLALAGISSVTLPGSTSGTVLLQPTAIAGTTTITLPATSGTVVTTGDTGTVTNTMLAGSIANGKLVNSSVTFNGVTVALGSSGTITSTTTNALTIGDGLSGTSFNGSAAVTIAADATIARRADTFSIGTTSVALNRTSGNLALTGISSIDFPTAGTNVIKLTPASTNALVTLTMPAQTGTIVTTGDTGTVTNTMLAGSIANGKLVNSSVTIGSTAVSLGSTVTTFTGLASVTSSAFSGPLTGNVTGNLTGNADTATKLATARTINGVSFDGTANITVTAAAGTLTGTTLNSTVVTSSLTSVGTIGTGIWQGTSIGTAYTDAKIVSVTGTANQITATTTTGAVALSLPQNIHTGATPTFASVTANNVVLGSAANTISTSTASTNLTLTSTGGTVAVTGNETVSGTLDVSGKTQVLTTLANNTVVLAVVNNNSTYTNGFPTAQQGANRFTVGADGSVEIKGDLTVRGATTITGAATISANFNTLINKPSPVVGVTLSGELSGSASTTLTELGAGTYTIALASTIIDNAVIASKIAADAVTTAKILNGNVTNAKLANSSITVTTAGGSGLSGGAVVNLGETVTLTNSDKGSSQSIFKNIAIAGTTALTANANNDILNFASDGTISLTSSTAGGNKTVNIVHATMGSQASVDNSGGTVIQDVTLNNGHVTGLTSVNLDTRFAPINTETLDSVTTRGSTTSNGITVGSLTTSGAISAATLTLSGDLIVNGTTTTINSSTVTVDDKNIELGSVPVKTGMAATLTSGSIVVNLTSGNTTGLIPGQRLTDINSSGGIFGSASIAVAAINNLTQFTVTSPHLGSGGVTFGAEAASDSTANGGGITLKGATDKTITWDSANTNWTSSEHWNLPTGKQFKINNTAVLTSTAVLGIAGTDIVTLTGSQTLTNKSISGEQITSGTINSARLDADLAAIAGISGTSGLLRKTAADTWSLDTASYLTGNQSISLTGDVTGTGATSISTTIANNAITTAKIANSNVTLGKIADIAAQRILGNNSASTSAAPAELTVAQVQVMLGLGTAAYTASTAYQPIGTYVTSVGATAPISSSGGTTPNISLSASYGDTQNPYGTKNANTVLAGPPSGVAAVPTFRALVAADIPSLDAAKITTGTFDAARIPSLNYQPFDADLAAIAGLTGTSGLLRKTNTDTWSLDTSSYLTSNPNLQTVCNVGNTTTTSITAGSFVKSGAFSTDILKGDGSTESDSNYVKTSGNQTIAGTKIFSQKMGIGSNSSSTAALNLDLGFDSISAAQPTRAIWLRPTFRPNSIGGGVMEGIGIVPIIDSSFWSESTPAMTYSAIRIGAVTRTGTTAVTETRGLYIDNCTLGTTNYAIYSAHTGASVFSGSLTATSFIGSAASLTNFPTLNQNTTGTAANVTGTVAVANGGTGATTFTAGYLKANAQNAFTTVASVPWSDVSSKPESSIVSSLALSAQTVTGGAYLNSTVYKLDSSSGTSSLKISNGTGVTVAYVNAGEISVSIPQAVATTSNVQFGSIGVGTAASGVSGEIRAIDNITAYYTSDERLKTNVRKIENALDKVTQINGVVYDWNDTYKKSHGDVDGYFVRNDNSGVIAQEVEKVFPNVVGERQDGFKAVRYELLVPLLIEAIKDLKAEIESLKANK